MKRIILLLAFILLAGNLMAANHGVTLSWGASTSASCLTASPATCTAFAYQIFEGAAAGQENMTTPLTTVSVLTFTDNGATMNAYLGTTRCYVVQAQETSGGLSVNSASSNEVCFSFPQTPAQVGTLSGTMH